MAQRAALARTLVRNPSILLLDEPLAALDAIRRYELQQELRAIIEQKGLSTLIVTHDVDEAVAIADRVVVLGGHPARIAAEISDADREMVLNALGFHERKQRRQAYGYSI
jgi:NitT/TauT family transport system ATP-binding protein